MTAPMLMIAFGVAAAIGLVCFAFAGALTGRVAGMRVSFEDRVRASHVSLNVTNLLIVACCGGLGLASGAIALLHPPVVVDAVLVAVGLAGGYAASGKWVQMKAAKRRKRFLPQLEMSLRMMSSSLRVGLGLRQAIVVVTEELDDPARYEFRRVIGRTNTGIGILDAIDELAERMPGSEMLMSARVIRVQSKTGGDLARVLEGVADTIRSRRQLVEKMQALTSEGRSSGIVILALPLLIGGFIMLTQPAMAHALFTTKIGLASLGLVVLLESAAAVSLNKIMAFDV